MTRVKFACLRLLVLLFILSSLSHAATYQYFRIGQKTDAQTKATPGTAMMGGGADLDEGFRWLCEKAGGGDFVVLRARGDDDYNSYVNGLCKLNSMATLIIPDRKTAEDPAVAKIIRQAEAVFIAGGDQSRYVNFWQGTPVQDAINANIAEGKPIGGTSAGLAILGEFSYGALNDLADGPDLGSPEVLKNPFHNQVTLVRNFLKVPRLGNTITDSHFAKRDRMGRSLVFQARLIQDHWSGGPREIAIDEKSAVLVSADGKAYVIGTGKGAYFMHTTQKPAVCKPNAPLTLRGIVVYHAPTGAHFDLTTWNGNGGESYSLWVEEGVVHSTRTGGSPY